jgi:hypothetical protein
MRFAVFRVVFAGLLLAGCASRPPVSPDAPLPFDEAAAVATDQLVAQVAMLPAFLALGARGIVHDPTLDAGNGQQTATTQRLDAAIAAHIARRHAAFEVLPFRPAHLAKSKYLLASTMARDTAAPVPTQRIELALVEIDGGTVVARASVRARDDGLDHAPLAYYRDSPVLVKDRVIDGYIATATTQRGQRGDAYYLERIAVASVVNEATELYNQARYREALGEYRSALAGPAGEQLRVLNGIYLANARLGNAADAEAAFGRVVAMGIAYRQLSVKFLFNPGTIAFWVDPRLNTPYPMWLRQIARETMQAQACMDIVGHTSKSGRPAPNEALSLRRAAEIRRRLVAEAPALSKRTNIVGMGFRETLIGSGTDDALDVLDRRVEFRVIPCGDVVSR